MDIPSHGPRGNRWGKTQNDHLIERCTFFHNCEWIKTYFTILEGYEHPFAKILPSILGLSRAPGFWHPRSWLQPVGDQNRFLGWGDPDQTPGFAVCRWFSQENQRILMNLKGICYYFLVPVPDQGQSKLCQAFVIFSKATGLLLNMSCHLVKSSKGLECMVQESIIVCLRRWIQMLFLYVGLQSWMVDFLMWTCGYLWKWSI